MEGYTRVLCYATGRTTHANRARGLLIEATTNWVGITRLQEDATKILGLNRVEEGLFCVVVVSCDADGSVHRDVRKLTRKLSNDTSGKMGLGVGNRLVVILLGHAVCSNSAMQMNSEIYRHGRKLAKFLGADKLNGTLVEVQVELDPPEVGFDPFIQRHVCNS